MATTYAELQTEIADFLNRDDVTNITPTFIQYAEGQLNRDVRHFKMERRADAQVDEQYLTLPTDWVETMRVTLTSSAVPIALNLASKDEMQDMRTRGGNTLGEPRYYCMVGGELELYPTPDSVHTIEILYRQRIPNLSVTNTSNWLLDLAPDLYLYAALVESAIYLRDDERLTAYAAIYQSKLTALNAESQKSTVSGSGLKLKIRSY